jgi:NADPH2:quinone reductase
MRSMQVTRFGGPEVMRIADVPEPEPGRGEVLVEVEVAEIQFLDTQLRAGWGRDYFTIEPPFTPGIGVAGRVVGLGEGVEESWRTTRVVASTTTGGEYRGGGYAERAVASVGTTHRVPDHVDLTDALAALHDGLMAVSRLEKSGLEPGDVALVSAATGGIGIWLVPLLSRAGVRVVAAAYGDRKVDLARERGADIAVDYADNGWVQEIRRQLGGGIDVVFDGAGGDLGAAALPLLARGGRFFCYGAAAGDFADVDELARERGIQVFDLHESFTDQDMARAADIALQQLAERAVQPVIGQRLPLERAAEAHAAIAERRIVGKSVLVP